MKRYYYLIAEEGTITLQSPFFRVAVGQSKQGQHDFDYMQRWSREHNFYLEIVSRESDEFIWMVANSLVPSETIMPLSVLDIRMIDVHDIVMNIKNHQSFKAHSHAGLNVYQTRYVLDTDFRVRQNIA